MPLVSCRGFWAYIVSHRWGRPPILPGVAVLSAALHRVFFGIFKTDEPMNFQLRVCVDQEVL